MGWNRCEECLGTGEGEFGMCSTCNGIGKVRQAFKCPVCIGQYYVPRDPPIRVRCPHCGSVLLTDWTYVQVFQRGTVPVPAPGRKAPLGLIGGTLLGLALGGPGGGVVGAFLGLAAGAVAEAPKEAQEV